MATISFNVVQNDTNQKKLSRTYSGVAPFKFLTPNLSPNTTVTTPAAPTNFESWAEYFDDCARAITSLSKNTYVDSNLTIKISMKEEFD